MFQVAISGDTQAKLAALAASARSAEVRAAFRGAARDVALAERAEAPKASGRLRSAIQWFLTRKKATEAFAKIKYRKAPHAHLVINGTVGRRVPSKSRGGRFLAFVPKGRRKAIARRSVGPMRGNDFWSRVASSATPRAVQGLISSLAETVEARVRRP